MAQDISLLGATYLGVPSVTLPKSGGGTASFDDTTDANATAADIASGKTAYVNGNKVTGTATGSTDFVVTIDYDSQDNTWKPDCTLAQIQAAYTAGKNIAVVNAYATGGAWSDGWYQDYNQVFIYTLIAPYDDIFKIIVYDLDSNGISIDDTADLIAPNFETVTKTYTPTASSQSDTVTFDSNTYNGLQQVNVTVNAMPSGSATPAASITGTSATVSTGTNTLTLSKTVSNTPQVSAGYVSSGTAGNSSVSLTANVTTKAAATYHPSSSQQTIASGTYLTGTQTINAVTTTNLTAANIKNGVTVTVGDSSDPDSVTSVTGTYSGGGSSKNVQAYFGRAQRTANYYGATDLTLTVAKTGTYNVYWTAWRSSSSGTMGTNLHRNNSSGTNQQTFTGTYGQNITLKNQSYTQGDVLTLYATSGSNSRSIYVANLIIEEQ